MKIYVNYDLLEEAAIAKKGFSIQRCSKAAGMRILFCSIFLVPIICMLEPPIDDIVISYSLLGLNAAEFDFMVPFMLKKIEKQKAIKNLTQLSHKLKDIFIDTDCEKLQEAKLYKTEYALDLENSTFPKVMQKKYIMVPIHNEWNNNERSLMQEHYIGSKDYALSYGEPEKEKVLPLTPKRVKQR